MSGMRRRGGKEGSRVVKSDEERRGGGESTNVIKSNNSQWPDPCRPESVIQEIEICFPRR